MSTSTLGNLSGIRWASRAVVVALAIGLCWTLSGSWAADADVPPAVPAKPPSAEQRTATAGVGRQVPNFVLVNANPAEGTSPATEAPSKVGLSDFADKKVIVLVVMGTGCPIGNLYLPDLVKAQAEFSDHLQIIGINANAGDTVDEIAQHADKFGLNFPVLCDPQQVVVDTLGATRTAETFVLDTRRVIRYQGRIDDRYTYTARKDKATREDAAEAVRDLLAGRPVAVPVVPVEGCLISRSKPLAAGSVTYHKDIAPLLQEKCQDCHRAGTAAPFSLLTYDDAVNWSAMIKEVVQTKRMPPWHADPRYGHFANARDLTAEQQQRLCAWVDGGTPEGDPATTPAPLTFADGWRIDQPDVVFELPRVVDVPATGTMSYQYLMTPTNFTEDMWIEQAEARPGDRGVVHHIIVFATDPKSKNPIQERNWLIAFAPGSEPLRLPAGIGRKIPKGSQLVWQMHYTPNGKATTDRSQVAFKFCKAPPEKQTRVHGIDNHRFRIPAQHPNYAVQSRHTLDFPVTLLAMMPHMHVRGKSFSYRATLPDGTKETLLSVPQFDFNWQTSYRLQEPRKLPKGTLIECVAHYDNSTANPANPDPQKTVTWGDQTFEEMMIGYLDYVEESE